MPPMQCLLACLTFLSCSWPQGQSQRQTYSCRNNATALPYRLQAMKSECRPRTLGQHGYLLKLFHPEKILHNKLVPKYFYHLINTYKPPPSPSSSDPNPPTLKPHELPSVSYSKRCSPSRGRADLQRGPYEEPKPLHRPTDLRAKGV